MLQTMFLRYLIEISHYRSLSVAAEKLHISQPALSKSIKKLEQELNVQLLNRTTKGVSLTEEGKRIVELAEKAFQYLDEIEQLYQNKQPIHNQVLSDTLKIYINSTYATMLIPDLSNELEQHPMIAFYNLPPSYDPEILINESKQNIILDVFLDDYEPPANISQTVLCQSDAYIMYSNDFPYIASKKTSISFSELLDIPLITSRASYCVQSKLLDILKKYGTPNIKLVAPDNNAAIFALKRNHLALLAIRLFKKNNIATLNYLPIRNAPRFKLCLLYQNNFPQNDISYLSSLFKNVIL